MNPATVASRPLITSTISNEAERAALYRRCTGDELKKFVKDRTKSKVQSTGSSFQLDACLHLLQLDQQDLFPFMSLPRDLRLDIEEILLLPQPGERLHSQILATCKTIHVEAQGFLNRAVSSGSIHLLRIRSNQDSDGGPLTSCQKLNCKCKGGPSTTIRHGLSPAGNIGTLRRIDTELAAFGPLNATATRLLIDIRIEAPCVGASLQILRPDPKINRHLYLLATAIQSTAITTVDLRLTCSGYLDPSDAIFMLWPLSCLGPNIALTISGTDSEVVENLRVCQAESGGDTTALSRYLPIKAQADDLIRRVQEARLEKTGVQFLPANLGASFNGSTAYIAVSDIRDRHPAPESCIRDNVTRAANLMANERLKQLAERVNEVLG
ncbi:hypothetical protein CLAFUW4_09185 [Fulvia fulva]|nr:hypothetical protein CLAFUR4_09191 [Fulvia fulva]KAK4614966.1 hypothetical protein CLAFUR0_09183 [Fulvia fulva]WPV20208.1 hypothetical protein CLAFUW4_09185 [Fulvia fulva]WPV34822.1 hypothetical protein CLAFUW7_09186 [Fulvia fulva]